MAELVGMGRGVGMSVFIHIQSGGKKETFLRGVAEDFTEEAIVAVVKEMLAHPDAHNLSRAKPKPQWAKRRPALKPDTEVLPGVEVDRKVEAALDRA